MNRLAQSRFFDVTSDGSTVTIIDSTLSGNTAVPEAGHGGRRTPLTAALSSDEGETWRIVGNLEESAEKTFSYVSLTFVRDRAVMSYWESSGSGRLSSRFRSLPGSWFYMDYDEP